PTSRESCLRSHPSKTAHQYPFGYGDADSPSRTFERAHLSAHVSARDFRAREASSDPLERRDDRSRAARGTALHLLCRVAASQRSAEASASTCSVEREKIMGTQVSFGKALGRAL